MEQAHRRTEMSPLHDGDFVEYRQIEEVKASGVAQRCQIWCARQQRCDGLLLDRKIVWNDVAATQQKRIDPVQSLAGKFFVCLISCRHRRERRPKITEEVLIGVQAAGWIELLLKRAEAELRHHFINVPLHA